METSGQRRVSDGAALLVVATRYPQVFFFLITFIYSWTIYLGVWIAPMANGTTVSRWCLVAAFGPSLAALLVSRVNSPEQIRTSPSTGQLRVFFLALLGVGLVEAIDHVVFAHRIDLSLLVADGFLVSLAALVISAGFSGVSSVREVFGRMLRPAGNVFWYVLAIALWPCLVLAGNSLASVLGFSVPQSPHPPAWPLAFVVVESFVWYLLLGGPLGEEAGWRGFSLTGLQQRFSPLTASVIIGFFWGLWHVPLHLMGFFPYGAAGALIRLFDIPTAILFTWLYNRSRQSLVPVLLLHAVRNTTSLFISRHYAFSSLLLLVLAMALVLLDRMWRRPEALEPQAALETRRDVATVV